MDLLERTSQLDDMQEWFQRAAGGKGCVLFLGGEAGVGKTALVQRFCQVSRQVATVLTGACDTLSTPRPLGPLLDIAPSLGDPVHHLLATGASRHELYGAVLAAVAAAPRPVLLVIEDAHWADEATLDLVRYLARRITPVRCMMIVTYRDDEVGPRHPLQVVLGDIATAGSVRRLSLPVLSPDAVSRLARGTALDPGELYRLTGGNPFYVTEVIAAGEPGLPPTVRDAVLARVARLPAAAREVVDVAAVIGGLVDARLLERAVDGDAPGIDGAVETGLLLVSNQALSFRHELARQAVHDALLPVHRRAIHHRVLAAMQASATPQVDLATLAHHAEGAGDQEAVLRYAPAAAREASSRRAHREAAAQYARALRFAVSLAPERRATLLHAYAYACYVSDQARDGIAALLEAREIWRRLGASWREAEASRWLSRLYWVVGQNAEAETASALAIEMLEPLAAGHELAMAYSSRSQLRMLANDFPAALDWGQKALALAERIGDVEALIHALNNVGTAKLGRGDLDGANLLSRSLEMARDHQFEDHAARA